MNRIKIALSAFLLLSGLTQLSLADERDRGREHRAEWRGEIGRFHEHDLAMWRAGRWRHGRHDGRVGWWWIVGGVWYFYPSRMESYPDPYQPPTAVVAAPSTATQYWYYCANPAGYYPYVPQCAVAWQAVPANAQPAAVAPSAPQPYPPPLR